MFGGVLCDTSESHEVWMEFPKSCQTTISVGTRSLASRVPKHSDGNLPTSNSPFPPRQRCPIPLHFPSFRSSLSCIYELISKKRLEIVLLIDTTFFSKRLQHSFGQKQRKKFEFEAQPTQILEEILLVRNEMLHLNGQSRSWGSMMLL